MTYDTFYLNYMHWFKHGIASLQSFRDRKNRTHSLFR